MKKPISLVSKVIMLGIITMVFACQSNDKKIATNYDGRTLMKAVFFRDGEAVKHLPLLNNNFSLEKMVSDKGALAKVRLMEEQILDRVEKNNPKAFEEFQKNITSGNHLLVSRCIESYSKEIISAYKELHGTSVNINGIAEWDLALVSYRYIFVINEIAVQVTTDIDDSKELLAFSDQNKQLLRDQLVDTIVKNLSNESKS